MGPKAASVTSDKVFTYADSGCLNFSLSELYTVALVFSAAEFCLLLTKLLLYFLDLVLMLL